MNDDVVEQAFGAIATGRSVVLGGVMGVGKTHMARVVSDRLHHAGWACTNINPNAATATIPFGALAEFSTFGELPNKLSVLTGISDAIRSLGHGRPHLVVIDDAPLLDDQSVAVLHQLLIDADIQAITTARTPSRENSALEDLWNRLDFERIEVEPLSDHDATLLVRQRFDTKLDPATTGRIVQRAEGNPLFLIELARAAEHGLPSGLTRRLQDMVGDRITRLDGPAREQLEFVAVSDPFDTDQSLAETDALELLEREGLITTSSTADGVVARPAHPLYGEIVRESLTALQRKEVSRRLAAGLATDPRARPGDALRLAGWLLACGDTPSIELAIPAAHEAILLLDVELANVLVGIATAGSPGFDALFVAGQVARMGGDIEQAMHWFERAFTIAEQDSDLRTVALAMGQVHGFYRNRPDEAVRVLALAADRIQDETERFELEIERVLFGSMLGRYADVLEAAELVLNHPESGVEARWTACTNVAWAEVQLIDLRKVHGHLDAAFALIEQVENERAGEVDLLHGVKINVLVEEGRLDDALALGVVSRSAESGGMPQGLTQFAASQAAWMSGDVHLARSLLDSAIDQLDAFDAFNAYPFVRAASASLAFVAGDPERAQADISASIARGGGSGMWDQLWLARAKAWSEATFGRTEEAVSVLVEGARVGLETSHYGWSALALHDAAAWGAAPAVADMLRSLRYGMHGAPLMTSISDSVLALADGDLDAAADQVNVLFALGSRWHAGVVSSGLALALHATGHEAEARRAAASAMVWLPPEMPHATAVREISPSQGQIIVVREALKGQTDREIANSLFLSPRTVSNHLGAIYASLEVSSRGALVQLLDPASDSRENDLEP